MSNYPNDTNQDQKPNERSIQRETSVGEIVFISDKGDFGFILHAGDEQIFFHTNHTIEPTEIGDKVIFSIRTSKRKENKLEAILVRKIHRLKDDSELVLSNRIFFLPGAKEKLLGVIDAVEIERDADKSNEIVIQLKLDEPEEKSYLRTTTADDEIFYAKRSGKKSYSRFVKPETPVESDTFTIIIRHTDEYFKVVAAYFGVKVPAEPWDRSATEDAVKFWQSHALIPHAEFKIDYSDVKEFDPFFFKSFDELQQLPFQRDTA